MAERLIDSYSGTFEPSKYEDTYRDALCEIIRAKRKGKKPPKVEAEEPERPPDLMEALRASLAAVEGGTAKASGNGSAKNGNLAKLSKDELYDRAKEADIKGRADMSKEELVAALKKVAA